MDPQLINIMAPMEPLISIALKGEGASPPPPPPLQPGWGRGARTPASTTYMLP